MNRLFNHCTCPRCSSPLPTAEFHKAVAITKLKHLPSNWRNRSVIAKQGWQFAKEESWDDE